MTIEAGTLKSSDDKPIGKDYHRPQLIMYGSIREITQRNGGTMGMNDGGGGPDKTGF
jgi:hypothetical protein